jgi:hypothetical protein
MGACVTGSKSNTLKQEEKTKESAQPNPEIV